MQIHFLNSNQEEDYENAGARDSPCCCLVGQVSVDDFVASLRAGGSGGKDPSW